MDKTDKMLLMGGSIDDSKQGSIAMPNGYNLYWRENPDVGGREYFSDEIGGGVSVWHTALVDKATIMYALALETSFQTREAIEKGSRREPKPQSDAGSTGRSEAIPP